MPLFRTRETPADPTLGDPRAAAIVQSAENGDLDGLIAALGEARTIEEREALTAVLPDIPGSAQLFDTWVEREPDSADAWLARGAHGVGWAWEARGGGYAEYVDDEEFKVFFERLRRAEESLQRAVELSPEDPVPWTHLLTSGRGLQVPKEEQWMRYEESKRRHPFLPVANAMMLQYLCQKWFGSDIESLEFAGGVAREAPDGSPVIGVLPSAHIEVWLDLHRRENGNPAAYISGPEVRQEIREMAERSVLREDFAVDIVTAPAVNTFAFAFYCMDEDDTAAQLVKRLGTRRTELPWDFFSDGAKRYAKLLG